MNSNQILLQMNHGHKYWSWTTEMVGQDLVDWFFKNYKGMNLPSFDPTSLAGSVSVLTKTEFYSVEHKHKTVMCIGEDEDAGLMVHSANEYYYPTDYGDPREENDDD